MLAKQIVVLANSIKHGNHCVAGKCLATGEWVRPVSSVYGDALNDDQIRCRNPYGLYKVKTLQKVMIEFDSAVPLLNQPENHLIAANSEWQQNYNIRQHELSQYLDEPISLWGKGCRVAYSAMVQNQCKPEQSLFLVQTEGLELHYTAENKRRVRFVYKGIRYDLPATDPQFDSLVNERRDVQGILCISLGENLDGHCYKIVAAIY
tara:strand:- start:28471 stop:29088 length:618 start_codon:yes stop_codon:yes gene_type:complete